MKTPAFTCLLLLLLGLCHSTRTQAAFILNQRRSFPDFAIHAKLLFPEKLGLFPNPLDSKTAPNLPLRSETGEHLTYLEGNKEEPSSFGYFLFEDLNEDSPDIPTDILTK